jgi:hypothetical protein
MQGAKHAAQSLGGLTKAAKKESAKKGDFAVPSMFAGKFKKTEIEAFKQ